METLSFLTIIYATVSLTIGLILGMFLCTLLLRNNSDRKAFKKRKNHYKTAKSRKNNTKIL